MKNLYILRHSIKDNHSLEKDYNVPLSKEGEELALKSAKEFKKQQPIIDLIISSPSKRTRQTSEIFFKELKLKKNIIYNEILYKAFLNELIETISYIYDIYNNILLVGHNPSLSSFALSFVDFKDVLKECSIMQIQFECDNWIEISKNNAKLINYKIP